MQNARLNTHCNSKSEKSIPHLTTSSPKSHHVTNHEIIGKNRGVHSIQTCNKIRGIRLIRKDLKPTGLDFFAELQRRNRLLGSAPSLLLTAQSERLSCRWKTVYFSSRKAFSLPRSVFSSLMHGFEDAFPSYSEAQGLYNE